MSGPPSAALLVAYAAAAGVGAALVATSKQGGAGAEVISSLGLGVPTDESAAKLAAGIAAANAWRAAADAEYAERMAAARKRDAEAAWFAAYSQRLRDNAALKAQVARSAEAQVARNKAVSSRNLAAEDDVAAPPKKGGLFGFLGGLLGRK